LLLQENQICFTFWLDVNRFLFGRTHHLHGNDDHDNSDEQQVSTHPNLPLIGKIGFSCQQIQGSDLLAQVLVIGVLAKPAHQGVDDFGFNRIDAINLDVVDDYQHTDHKGKTSGQNGYALPKFFIGFVLLICHELRVICPLGVICGNLPFGRNLW
jgi:hypothetical protein